MERTALMIANLAKLLAGFTLAPVVFCAAVSGQQSLPIYGKVLRPGKTAVVGAEVRIEKGSSTHTGNSGEFELPMPPSLHVGMASVFTVTHYVILAPCELQRGRAYLRDPSMEAIEFLVLPLGDHRLKAANLLARAKADPVIRTLLKCVIEEQAPESAEKSKAGGKSRGSLSKEQRPPVPGQTGMNLLPPNFELIPSLSRSFLMPTVYHLSVFQRAPVPSSAESQESADPIKDEVLAKKSKELGVTVEELKSAMDVWAESAEDPYEKGLAALREQRYADASRYISASIASSHGDVLKKYVNLARAEYGQAHYGAAESALRRVLAVHSNDPLVLNLLGLVLLYQRNYSEAEPLLKRALTINEKTLGPEHPEVATQLSNLAELYRKQGMYAEAEPLYKRALAIDKKVLGPQAPGVARALHNMAELYRDQGRYAEAEPLYKSALAIDEKALGPEHPSVAVDLNNLGLLYYELGRYSEAEPLYKRARAIDEKALGWEHRDIATDLNNLGLLYYQQGKYKEAESLYKRALAIDEKALGPERQDVTSRLNNLAELYREEGRYAEAEPLYQRALAIDEKTLGPEHPVLATDLGNLGSLYYELGRYAEAEPLYKRALVIDEKALGWEHPDVATGLNNLGLLYYQQGKYKEAEPLYKRALAIDEKALGPEHPEVSINLNNLGSLYFLQGKYAEAEPLYQRALAIDEKALGPEHPSVANISESLASLLRKLGRNSEADAYSQRAAKIRAQKKQ